MLLLSNHLVGKLNHLGIFNDAGVDGEFHQRAHRLPALFAGGTWIDVQQIQLAVGHNLEYV